MNRRIFNFLVLAITILLVNLLTTLIGDYLMEYRGNISAVKFTAIGMCVIVIVFYPAFEYLNVIIEKFTTRFLKKGNNIFGRTLGVYITFLLLIFVLYCIYAHIWFDVNIPKTIIKNIFS